MQVVRVAPGTAGVAQKFKLEVEGVLVPFEWNRCPGTGVDAVDVGTDGTEAFGGVDVNAAGDGGGRQGRGSGGWGGREGGRLWGGG